MLQCPVATLLDAKLVGVHPVPEELGVLRRRRPHHGVGVEVLRHLGGCLLILSGDEFHDAPHHFGNILVTDRPRDPLGDEEGLAQGGLLGAHHIGQFGGDTDLFTGPQIPVVGLLAVGGNHTDVPGVVEEAQDLAQRIVVGPDTAEAIMVQTWIMAGGATIPGCPAARAAASST